MTIKFQFISTLAPWTIATFLEHMRKIVGVSNDTDQNNKILRFADMMLADLLARYDWPWAHGADTITTTAGVSSYSLASDSAFIDGNNMQVLDSVIWKVPLTMIRQWQSVDARQATPQRFAITLDNAVTLHPTPDKQYSISYDYTKVFETFLNKATTENLPLPAAFQNMLIFGVEYMMLQTEHANDQTTAVKYRQYENAINAHIFRLEQGVMEGVGGDDHPTFNEYDSSTTELYP
jgi:hypothetical protein